MIGLSALDGCERLAIDHKSRGSAVQIPCALDPQRLLSRCRGSVLCGDRAVELKVLPGVVELDVGFRHIQAMDERRTVAHAFTRIMCLPVGATVRIACE